MAHVELHALNAIQISSRSQEKLLSMQINLNQLTREIVNKDIDLIENETSKISKFAQGIQSILSSVMQQQQKCSKTVKQLQSQVNQLKFKITQYENEFTKTNKQKSYKNQIEQHQQQYLKQWQKRIQLSGKVNVQPLLKVNIQDRKSKANQVFKWIIVTIYGEPEAKYYWPNFKEQVFERDQGKDFKERLGKINPSNAKEQAKLKTNELINSFNQIRKCPQLGKVRDQVQKIYNIALIFLKCHEMSKTIKDLQVEIIKSREQFLQKDEQSMRWKARTQALQDRIKTNNQYLRVLKNVESKLNGKIQAYREKQAISRQVIDKLKKKENISDLVTNIEDDKRDLCECRIF